MAELQGETQRTFVRAGGHLLAQQNRDNDRVAATLIAGDRHNSVLHASNAGQQTDIAYSPTRLLAYSPYGHHDAAQPIAGLPGFNGEQPDPITGHYLLGNGYRAFNPVLMRFNSPDSLSPFGKGGLNAYAYCAGDPINQEDPIGHIVKARTILGIAKPRSRPLMKPTNRLPTAHLDLTGFGELDAFLGTPHILDKIVTYSQGNDLVNFSLSSRSTKELVRTAIKPLVINTPADALSRDTIYKLRAISLGEARGYLPSQVLKWQNLKDMAKEMPKTSTPMVETYNKLTYIRSTEERQRNWRRNELRHRHLVGNADPALPFSS
ncbi:Uncharacterized protein ABJ99_3041 [Pseudomonas syringae pv. cilantro]|nr:Uncharacterized protein ABJ99_3041 [Pseudomonas syringae pv. cilantro]